MATASLHEPQSSESLIDHLCNDARHGCSRNSYVSGHTADLFGFIAPGLFKAVP